MACYAMVQRGIIIESMAIIERKFLYKIPQQQPLSNNFKTFEHAFLKIMLNTGYMCVDVSLKQEKPIARHSHKGHYDSVKGNMMHYDIADNVFLSRNQGRASIDNKRKVIGEIMDPRTLLKEPEYYTGLTIPIIYDFCMSAKTLPQDKLDELRTYP